jgi:hypothetical protein
MAAITPVGVAVIVSWWYALIVSAVVAVETTSVASSIASSVASAKAPVVLTVIAIGAVIVAIVVSRRDTVAVVAVVLIAVVGRWTLIVASADLDGELCRGCRGNHQQSGEY